jgi:hypothetical protein
LLESPYEVGIEPPGFISHGVSYNVKPWSQVCITLFRSEQENRKKKILAILLLYAVAYIPKSLPFQLNVSRVHISRKQHILTVFIDKHAVQCEKYGNLLLSSSFPDGMESNSISNSLGLKEDKCLFCYHVNAGLYRLHQLVAVRG